MAKKVKKQLKNLILPKKDRGNKDDINKTTRLSKPSTKNKSSSAQLKSTTAVENKSKPGRLIEHHDQSKNYKKNKKFKSDIKIPPTRLLFWQTINHIWRHKRIFFAMFLLTVALNILFVKGFASVLDMPTLKKELQETAGIDKLTLGTTLVGVVASSGNSGSTDMASTYQSMFMIIFSLAYIWLFRSTTDSPKLKINLRKIFYNCMTPLVQFLGLLVVVGVQLLPMIIGLSIFTTVQVNGIAVTILETVLWGSLALVLSLLSFHLLSSTLLSLFIVTVPGMTPMSAYKTANKLSKGLHWVIMRRFLVALVLVSLILGLTLLGVVMLTPSVAEWVMVLLSAITLPVVIGMGFKLYKAILQ